MSLTTATAVENYLGIALDADQLAAATLLLPAADAAIARYTERAWGSAPIVGEVYTSDGPILVLRQRPIVSVERVAAGWYMAPTVPLTAGSQYAIRDAGRGLLLLSPWWASRPNARPYATIVVDYSPVSTVPADVALAATMLVAHLLQPNLGDGLNAPQTPVVMKRVDGEQVQYAAPAVPAPGAWPAAIQALLAPYRNAWAFA